MRLLSNNRARDLSVRPAFMYLYNGMRSVQRFAAGMVEKGNLDVITLASGTLVRSKQPLYICFCLVNGAQSDFVG